MSKNFTALQVPQPTQDSEDINYFGRGGHKESEPVTYKESPITQESTSESQQESSKPSESSPRPQQVTENKEIPDIHPDAVNLGVSVSPSVSPFPTLNDVKVPILKDEEIEKNLHSSFFSSARWLAEVCRYILWQAHIRLKKVGKSVVRERVTEKF